MQDRRNPRAICWGAGFELPVCQYTFCLRLIHVDLRPSPSTACEIVCTSALMVGFGDEGV